MKTIVKTEADDVVVFKINGERAMLGKVVKPNGIVVQVETNDNTALPSHRNSKGELWLNDYEISSKVISR